MESGDRMTILRDRQIKRFVVFMIVYFVLGMAAAIWFCHSQISYAKSMYLEHDTDIVSSLLEQGVSKEVIARAVSNTGGNEEGRAFLYSLGIREETMSGLLPAFSEFQKHLIILVFCLCFGFMILLILGVFLFLWIRNQLYMKAGKVVIRYIDNDYSCHMPHSSEGEIYSLFSGVEQLATMLRSQNEKAYKTKQFLKDTISDISHQLKTPLSALMMYQEIIASEPDQVDTVKEFAGKMGIAINRIEQLIQAMLKITRLDTGNIVFEKRGCHIKEVVVNGVNELVTRAEKENKLIVIEGDAEQTILCDMEWTSEAIGNIVKNALDHTESGGMIRIEWEKAALMTHIIISDNGGGIAQEDIHHIFKRFYRSQHYLNTQGIGLGLSLAKSIVEGQNGVISVQSVINEGTKFTISFLTESQV